MLFMAVNGKGFVINLSAVRTPEPVQVNEQFVPGFESTMYQPGQVKKRGGRFITFRGLQAYQAESALADGRTSVTWVFNAHGFLYILTLLGGQEPVEKNPAFNTIMQGFEFTAPPEPAAQGGAGPAGGAPPAQGADYDRALNISAWMGRIAGACILAVLLLLAFRWAAGKRKTSQ
jgi:hypothetical protein